MGPALELGLCFTLLALYPLHRQPCLTNESAWYPLYILIDRVPGAYNNITRGDLREALGAQILWFVLELGVAVGLIAYFITGLTTYGVYAGAPFVLLWAGMMLYLNGAYGIMDVTGFLGTILSYARLLALCLSTGGIAMTVNILTGLAGSLIPYVGFILAPIVSLVDT